MNMRRKPVPSLYDLNMNMSRKPVPSLSFFSLLVISLQLETIIADPRAQTIELTCTHQLAHNNTIFGPNFVAAMENLKDKIQTTGFGVTVVGSGPDTNYGLAQCYGDLSPLDCLLCYAMGRTILPQCFSFTGGRIYLDGCFMRSDNYSFFQEFTGPGDKAVCGNTTQKEPRFQESARRAVLDAAAVASSDRGYARSEVRVSGLQNESAYVLADCWKTLNASSCKACLENASASVMGCLPWSEGRAVNTGCFMRYSDRNFLNKEESDGRLRGSIKVMVISIVSSVPVVFVGVAIGVYIWKHRIIQKKRKGSGDALKMAQTLLHNSLNFKYSTLEKATGNFDNANKIGQGGFGIVYKGVMPDGREIAVKRLLFNNRHRATDLCNEVNIISKVEHKNLVRLLGCCCSGLETLLVYEFLPNKSLDRFLFDPNRGKALNWEKRFEIIKGTIEGLVYLHENPNIRIIHRDIKASNILLDSNLQAKIADFGLARSFQGDKSHISTAIAGTLGYMAPEYLARGMLTEKADVYSFGVLLLEIVTGWQNNGGKTSLYPDSLVISTWKHFQLGTAEELFDTNLMLHNYTNNCNIKKEILRAVHVGLLCTQEVPLLRPSMSKALQMLSKDEQLPAPSNPAFIDESTMEFNHSCKDTSPSIATVSCSSFYPR